MESSKESEQSIRVCWGNYSPYQLTSTGAVYNIPKSPNSFGGHAGIGGDPCLDDFIAVRINIIWKRGSAPVKYENDSGRILCSSNSIGWVVGLYPKGSGFESQEEYLYFRKGMINMSLDKAIKHGKEHRKPYTGSKKYFSSCCNHGSCLWCQENRKHKMRDKHPEEKEDKIY